MMNTLSLSNRLIHHRGQQSSIDVTAGLIDHGTHCVSVLDRQCASQIKHVTVLDCSNGYATLSLLIAAQSASVHRMQLSSLHLVWPSKRSCPIKLLHVNLTLADKQLIDQANNVIDTPLLLVHFFSCCDD